MSPTDSAPLRIRVTNLDSVHQAQTWRRHGPQEAIDRTVSMIRSALLLSEQIIVDRNQLLDGVVLLALGPEGLRWHLGLPQHAPLPLVVTGSAPPGARSIDVAEQLAAVTRPTFTSAARAALTAEVTPGSPWEWLLPPMADPAATRLPARHASPPVGRGIDDDLQEARVAWAHSMTCGEVTTAPWTQITQVPAPSPGDRVLEQHPVLTALIDLDEVPTRRGQGLKILAAQRAAHPPRRDALPAVDPRGAAAPGDPLRGRDRRQHAPDLPVRVPAAAAHLPATHPRLLGPPQQPQDLGPRPHHPPAHQHPVAAPSPHHRLARREVHRGPHRRAAARLPRPGDPADRQRLVARLLGRHRVRDRRPLGDAPRARLHERLHHDRHAPHRRRPARRARPARFLTSPGAGRAGAVAVCRRARDGEQQTLLVRVRRVVVGRELWELPRGAGTARSRPGAGAATRRSAP